MDHQDQRCDCFKCFKVKNVNKYVSELDETSTVQCLHEAVVAEYDNTGLSCHQVLTNYPGGPRPLNGCIKTSFRATYRNYQAVKKGTVKHNRK